MYYNILLFALLLSIAVYFFVRFFWIFKNLKSFLFVMASYAKMNNIENKEIVQYCKLQSISGILFDMTNWEFVKYIVSKDKYADACLFHINLMFKILDSKNEETQINDTKQSTEKDSK